MCWRIIFPNMNVYMEEEELDGKGGIVKWHYS
jgi:hypothetical protein